MGLLLISRPWLYMAPDQPTVTDCRLPRVITVQLFGDSTQAGWDGSKHRIGGRTPEKLLQRQLDLAFGKGRVVVEGRGVSGTTLLQLVEGADGKNARWPQPAVADVVVINHGINDARDSDLTQYRAALSQLANPPGRLVFETPNVVTKNYDVRPYAQAMRDEAQRRGVPVADVHAYTKRMLTWPLLIPDHYHPTERMYELIVSNSLAPAVVEQVRHFCT